MFYVKSRGKNGKVYKNYLYGDSIYTICPNCGKEFPVDVVELIEKDCKFDFLGTNIYCSKCSKNHTNHK